MPPFVIPDFTLSDSEGAVRNLTSQGTTAEMLHQLLHSVQDKVQHNKRKE